MDWLKIEKYELYKERKDGNYYDFVFQRDGNKTLSIFFGGNLDLYFSLENFDDDPTFIIGKDYYEIYMLFDKLYSSVINADIYGEITEEEKDHLIFMNKINQDDYHREIEELKRRERYRKFLKNSHQYKNLVQDGLIIWLSDEYFDEVAPFVKIKKQENVYILEFGKSKIPLEYQNDADLMLMDPRRITVRFRNSGSRYDPFNIIFMGLYQGLCNLDYEYHQIHIEEYLQESKIKSRVLKR